MRIHKFTSLVLTCMVGITGDRCSLKIVPFFLTTQVRRLPSRAAMLTHLKNCHEEMKLEIMGEEDEEEEFGDPLGMVATII